MEYLTTPYETTDADVAPCGRRCSCHDCIIGKILNRNIGNLPHAERKEVADNLSEEALGITSPVLRITATVTQRWNQLGITETLAGDCPRISESHRTGLSMVLEAADRHLREYVGIVAITEG